MTVQSRKSAKRRTRKAPKFNPDQFEKSPTGIQGLDEITGGGLPKGRPTLICGSPGCGKTLFGMEFLVTGAELTNNVASLHYAECGCERQARLGLGADVSPRSD